MQLAYSHGSSKHAVDHTSTTLQLDLAHAAACLCTHRLDGRCADSQPHSSVDEARLLRLPTVSSLHVLT